MLENRSVLKVQKGEREYLLYVSNDSPLGELFDVLCDMKGFVYEKIQDQQKIEDEYRAKDREKEIKLVEPKEVESV